jgi:hypothetical protein
MSDASKLVKYQFQPGNTGGGRVKGSRNKLALHFVADLQAEWEEHGREVIRIARIEKPVEFMKVIASVLPKEFEITDSRIKELNDDELEFLIRVAQRRLDSVGSADCREIKEADRGSAEVLPALPKAG